MKALTLTAVGSLDALQVQDVPPPPRPGPDQVLLKVRTVALNRLDLFVVDGLPGVTLKFPHVVCSDVAGRVEAVGSAVAGLEPGQRVMVNPGISCYACEYCLRGDHSLCRSYGLLGEHVPGAAAELLLVPARNVAPRSVPKIWTWLVRLTV